MGKIACANVLSDLYAMGVIDCDNMLMLLGVSTKMTEKERDVVIPLIMRGFKVSLFSVSQLLTIAINIHTINFYHTNILGFGFRSANECNRRSKRCKSMVYNWWGCKFNLSTKRLYCS